MRYLIVAEAYRDLEQATGRLVLTERLAALLAQTPAELLPTVCYLCQGLIAPEFAGVDLGLAEKMAVRAVGAATGAEPAEVAGLVREVGDLGQAAEQLLTARGSRGSLGSVGDGRAGSLEVTVVMSTLREIAAADGAGSQGRKLELLAGLLALATPAGGPLSAAPGDQESAAGHRHAHHLGRAGSGARGREGRPAGAGTRL